LIRKKEQFGTAFVKPLGHEIGIKNGKKRSQTD
jgi:hypothetical protein